MNELVLAPDRYLSKDELGTLLRRAEELRGLGVAKNRKQPIRDWMIIQLAIYSGLRVSELAALKVTDCYIGYGRAELLVRRGKGGRQRSVKIGDHLKTCLRWYIRWKAQQGELHPEAHLLRSQRTEKMSRGAVWYRWKAHCPGHRVHDARHSFGTLLLEASGGNLRVVQKALGHSRITTTSVYAAVVDEKMRQSMKAMDRLTRQAMKPRRNPQPGRLVLDDVDGVADEFGSPAV